LVLILEQAAAKQRVVVKKWEGRQAISMPVEELRRVYALVQEVWPDQVVHSLRKVPAGPPAGYEGDAKSSGEDEGVGSSGEGWALVDKGSSATSAAITVATVARPKPIVKLHTQASVLEKEKHLTTLEKEKHLTIAIVKDPDGYEICLVGKEAFEDAVQHGAIGLNDVQLRGQPVVGHHRDERSGIVTEHEQLARVAFFILGAGTDVLFNSTVLSVAYWRMQLGPTVLAQMSMAQFLPSMLAQAIALYTAKQRLDIPSSMLVLAIAYSFMLSFASLVIGYLVAGVEIPPVLFITGCAVSGACCGISQSHSAALAAFFSWNSTAKGMSAAHMSGNSFGVLVPVVINTLALFFVPYPLSAAETKATGESTTWDPSHPGILWNGDRIRSIAILGTVDSAIPLLMCCPRFD
jgi:hypothetical protein